MERAVQMLDRLITMHPARNRAQIIITSLILFSKFFMTIVFILFYRIPTPYYIYYRIMDEIAPVVDIFACCATPSP